MMRILSALAALFSLSACSPLAVLNAVVPHGTFVETEGITFREGPRGKLDVYMPKDEATTHPVIVFLYGGAWDSGDRGNYLFVAEALASRGFVVVIPDYRVYPKVRYPAFVEDAAAAFAWTKKEIGRYKGDPDKVFLMGHSAGAHIGAMVTYNERFLGAHGLKRSDVRGFIGLAGPYDFVPDEEKIIAALSGEGDPVKTAMPARFVHGGEPPSLLIRGDKDTRVGAINQDRLVAALKAAGSSYQDIRYPDMTHSTVVAKLAKPLRNDALLDAIAQFARR
ncbi:MAG: alpha/beta hydrolase [Usitatibacter sp.]